MHAGIGEIDLRATRLLSVIRVTTQSPGKRMILIEVGKGVELTNASLDDMPGGGLRQNLYPFLLHATPARLRKRICTLEPP